MKIESQMGKLVISKGNKSKLFFSFFVDGKASWTKRAWACAYFETTLKAAETLDMIYETEGKHGTNQA